MKWDQVKHGISLLNLWKVKLVSSKHQDVELQHNEVNGPMHTISILTASMRSEGSVESVHMRWFARAFAVGIHEVYTKAATKL